MSKNRPYVMSVSGHDPSGGAGLLADIKTFEMHKVQGLGVCSAITYQNENDFAGIDWIDEEKITKQIDALFKLYIPKVLKIGIVESLTVLENLIDWIKNRIHEIQVVWDPVIKASAGFNFHHDLDKERFFSILNKIDLLTPNLPEFEILFGITNVNEISEKTTSAVLLKGGHSDDQMAVDQLVFENQLYQFEHRRKEGFSKHGTGCILSSAIAANLALGQSIPEACMNAKEYIQPILISNSTRLAYHYANE